MRKTFPQGSLQLVTANGLRRFRFRAGCVTLRNASFYASPVFIPLILVAPVAAGLAALVLPLLIIAWDRVRWLDVHDDGRLVVFSLTKVVRFTANEVAAARWTTKRSPWERQLHFELEDGTNVSCRATTIPTQRRGQVELSYLSDVRELLAALSRIGVPTHELSQGALRVTPQSP